MIAADGAQAASPSLRRAILLWCVDLAIVLAFVAAIYPALVFTGQTLATDEFFTDLLALTQPTFTYTGEELLKGHIPLWNPYWFAGYPHLAMPSACVFYPTTILFGLFRFEVAIKIVVLLHCFLAGAFSYALGRNTFGRRVPALYLAFAAIAGDLVLPAIKGGQLWVLQTLTWFPLAVLLIHFLCSKGRWGSVVGLAVTIALMVFAGDPQSLAFCLWFLGAYVAALLVIRLWNEPAAWRDVALSGAMCMAGVVLGIALAGVQLAPSRELYAESIRANGVAYEYMNFGIFPAVIQSFLWLQRDDVWCVMVASRTVIALAAAGLIFARHPAARATAFAAIPCLLYTLMPVWFYDLVVRHLPMYNGVRGAFRMSMMVWWAVAYLSAFGVAVWTARPAARRPSQVGIVVVTLATLGLMMLLPVLAHNPFPAARVAACVIGAAGAILFFFHAKLRLPYVVAPALVVVAAMLELEWKANTANTSGDPAPYAVDSDVATFSSTRKDMDRVALMYNWLKFRHGTAVGLLTRDRVMQGYHGLFLTRYARLFRDVADIPIATMDGKGHLVDTGGLPEDWLTEKMIPLLSLFNVRHIVSIEYRCRLAESLSRPGGPFTKTRHGKLVDYANTRALPPVFPIHEITWCDSDDEAVALMREGRIDFGRQATLTGKSVSTLRPATGPEPVTITGFASERVSANVELSAPAIVVFSEMYYPGWQASVDGEPRELLCVDTVLRGVLVEEGKHEIVLRYRPASLIRGAYLSGGAGLLILGVTIVLAGRRRKSPPGVGLTTPV